MDHNTPKPIFSAVNHYRRMRFGLTRRRVPYGRHWRGRCWTRGAFGRGADKTTNQPA